MLGGHLVHLGVVNEHVNRAQWVAPFLFAFNSLPLSLFLFSMLDLFRSNSIAIGMIPRVALPPV